MLEKIIPRKRKKEKKSAPPVSIPSRKSADSPFAESPPPFSVAASTDQPDKLKYTITNPIELSPPSAVAATLPDVNDTPAAPTSSPAPGDQLDKRLPVTQPAHTSQSILQGAKHFKIENSVLTNIQGNAIIFKLDGDSPFNEEFKALFAYYMAGLATIEDLDKLQKHVLIQAIRDLPRANAAYNDYVSKDRRRMTCFQGTRQGLLKEMATWVTDANSLPIYVLSGPAGMGKSTIAQTIAAKTDVLRYLGASFFFSREESDRRNAQRFFATIAFQLCNYDRQFAQAIGDALVADGGAAAPTKQPLEQLRALILEPLSPLVQQRPRPVLVIVDALDECEEEDGRIILTGLDQLVRGLRPFKVILTTRPQPHLQYLLANLPTEIFYLQNIEDKIVDSDIRLYLEYNLSADKVKSRLPYMESWGASSQEVESLVQVSSGLFIIASTAIPFILDAISRDPETRLKKVLGASSLDRTPLTALNNFYAVILRSAIPEDCDPDVAERYKVVIGAIVTTQELLTIDMLADLIGLLPKDIHAVLINLQSVISLSENNNIPRIYHKSFIDYITNPKHCKDINMLITPKVSHTHIADRCLNIMNTGLRRDILGLGDTAQFLVLDEGLEGGSANDRVRENIKPHLQYACVYWANHFKDADTKDSSLMKGLQKFAEEHILHWIEALSWTKNLRMAHYALTLVLKLLKSAFPNIYDLLYDGLRFVSKFFEIINDSAPHTYHSALLFSPTKSQLYQKSRNELLKSLCLLEGGPEEWDPLIANPSHQDSIGGINRVAFSQNSSQFASWSDLDLKIWDATSGTPLRTFGGTQHALSQDFSIVASSRGRKMTIYDGKKNTLTATQSHPVNVIALALSFDGSRVAVALSDGTVNLYDPAKDKPIAAFSGYVHGRIDPDEDWDTESEEGVGPRGEDDEDDDDDDNWESEEDGEEVTAEHEDDGDEDGDEDDVDTKEDTRDDDTDDDDDSEDDDSEDDDDGPNEDIPIGQTLFRLTFSRGGDQLAFVSTDGIKLWNSTDGEHISNMNHGLEEVLGLIFMPDNSGLISLARGDKICNLRLWNNEGGCVGLIRDIGWTFTISVDGSLLATGKNRTVRLWNSKSLSLFNTFDVGRTVKSLALSQDMIAVASTHNVMVHGIRGYALAVSLEIDDPLVLAFSPDGTRLVAGGDGETEICLWDVPSLKTYVPAYKERKSNAVTALAISPDCLRVASGFGDGTVKLWDTSREGHVISIHRNHVAKVSELSFDKESELLASGSRDGIVKFWNGRDGSPINQFDYSFAGRLTSLSFSPTLLAVSTEENITLWDYKSSRLIGTLKPGGNLLSFSPDGTLLASTLGEDDVIVWEVETLKSVANFDIESEVLALVFLPDCSKLLSWSAFDDIVLLDITNNETITEDITSENLALIPHLNGIPITFDEDADYGPCLIGRFSDDHYWVPVLLMPRDVRISAFGSRPSMFVVGCKDGRIFFIRPSGLYPN